MDLELAIALGFRARSAFKLIEIQEKFDIFNLGKKYLHGKHIKAEKILDLGCAPGGWAQVVLKETNETIGHCELNYENGNKRLSRILIGKEEYRSKKLGELIVRKMADLFFQDPNVKMVDLNVFEWNTRAIRCYEKVGFMINHQNTDYLNVYGNSWTRLNMKLKRENYHSIV
jgi:23S rRNA U2552 (ribose-2'-O)-methylase RlmE/FtsJ